MPVRRFDLDNKGLARVLGNLEARILEIVWRLRQPTVKEVTTALEPDVHGKTVMTVMNRMVEKGLLARQARGRRFLYSAVLNREAFERQVVSRVLSGLLAEFPELSIEHMIEATTPQQLEELERLVGERRRRQEGLIPVVNDSGPVSDR